MKTLLFTIANTPKHLADHLFGIHHTIHHRKIAGGLTMLFGVALVKISALTDLFIIHYFADVIGFAIHGAGLLPWLESQQKN